MYRVRFLRSAKRDLERLDKPVAARILQRIRWLAEHIDDARLQPLTGDLEGLFKLRVGSYRVIYEILWQERTIVVHLVGHRRDIYRKR